MLFARLYTVTRSVWNYLLPLLLAVVLTWFWLRPAGQSFWVDETVTAFVVHHGAGDASLQVAPQVAKSIYYSVARAADAMFGLSEFGYRLPSMLIAGLALFLIGKLAARLIHPEAAWFAVFACLSLKGFNAEATDARPYALGFCVAAAAFLFLVRWLDDGRWTDAAGFAFAAALIWRVHLLDWPIYGALGLYAVARRWRRETQVSWSRIAAVFAAVGVALLPVALEAVSLVRGAHDHVIVDPPGVRELSAGLKFGLLTAGLLGGLLGYRLSPQKRDAMAVPAASAILIAGWWLIHPLSLFAYSRLSGNSVFVGRYLSIGLPGAALLATLLAAYSLPQRWWKPAAFVLGLGALFTLRDGSGQPHSDWRGASQQIAQLQLAPQTPVLCPSPFIEAHAPAWSPEYRLPGFLYAHLSVYPVPGKLYLLPFQETPDAETYAAELAQQTLPASGRFVIYGGIANAHKWRDWFERRPEMAGWRERSLGSFGDVDAVLFERPIVSTAVVSSR
jgi:hypothetical protein